MPGGEFGGGYVETDIETFKTFGKAGQKLSFIRKDSHKESTKKELMKILGNDKIDLLFIDGDHSYKGVKNDWEMYSPLVSKGGIIAFHDVCFHKYFPTCQVDKLWNEIKTSKSLEFIDPKDKTWGGIGVIEFENHKKK